MLKLEHIVHWGHDPLSKLQGRNISTYTVRTQELVRRMNDLNAKGTIILMGNDLVGGDYLDNSQDFVQDPDFLYYIGVNLPGLYAKIELSDGTVTLYGQKITLDSMIWTGPHPTLRDIADTVGIQEVGTPKQFYSFLEDLNDEAEKNEIHILGQYRYKNMWILTDLLYNHFNSSDFWDQNLSMSKQISRDANYASIPLTQVTSEMMSIKEYQELDYMKSLFVPANAAHEAAIRFAEPGVMEYEVRAQSTKVFEMHNMRYSFPAIMTIQGGVLHNHSYENILSDGDSLLLDIGGRSKFGYTTDVTRTVPVNGIYSSQQRETHQAIERVYNKVNEIAGPHMNWIDIHLTAAREHLETLKDRKIIKGSIDAALDTGAYGPFQPHGLGHLTGISVHENESKGENLFGYNTSRPRSELLGLGSLRFGKKPVPGNVLTNEPGEYYIKSLLDSLKAEGKFKDSINYSEIEKHWLDKKNNMRIEDAILITEDGCELLNPNPLPTTCEGLEELCKTN